MLKKEKNMGNRPKISIIVPIYNVDQYLSNCLTSLVQQTLADIEIICVDDCSDDSSGRLIDFYASKDLRIKPIHLEKNYGTSYARKIGVMQAEGEYIMFCDADDLYKPNACQRVWEEMSADSVDILQFGTDIEFKKIYTSLEKKNLKDVLTPYYKRYSGNLCKACFKDGKWKFTLWNKAYDATVCKKAFAEIDDTYILVSEDLYVFFYISFYGTTYRGIQDELYIYNFGIGITNNEKLDLKQFKKHCTKLEVVCGLNAFSTKKVIDQSYKEIIQIINNGIIEDIIYQWYHCLSISDAKIGCDLLVEKLGVVAVVSELAKNYWENSVELLDRLAPRERTLPVGKKVKNIGVYYHRMRNGGVEKVLSKLLFVWKELGYNVVLFTDEKETTDDYKLPDGLLRIVLTKCSDAQGAKYKKRARYWASMIKKYELDTILYHSCTSSTLFWDTFLIKGLGCNLVVETHSMFCGAMWYDIKYSSYLPRIYRMVDRIIALSQIDVEFWKNYAPTYYIPNPIDNIPVTNMSDCGSKNVLWVGRLAEEKNPYAILEAFSIVHNALPAATLTIVGDGDDPIWINGLQERAKQLGIDRVVDFCGYKVDIGIYYKKASIFTMTSLCESFSMVLAESKGYGLPTIMFELPNLELTRDGGGIISVPQEDTLALANEIIKLLKNDSLRQQMGQEARKSLETFQLFDIKGAWKEVLDSFERPVVYDRNRNSALMLDMLFENIMRGAKRLDSNSMYGYGNTNSRYEDVLNRHEEVINRHNASINHQWEIQKWHEERIQRLEHERSLITRCRSKLIRSLKMFCSSKKDNGGN